MILKSFLSPVTKRHVERKILAVPAMHLFRIVADVDAYSTFVPLCRHSRILQRLASSSSSSSEQRFEAQLTVGLPPFFQETYTSLVVANPTKLTIESRSIQSEHMDSLTSMWQLKEIMDEEGNKCDVQLEVSMTVRDPIIIAALDQMLESVARRQVAAFSKRCSEIPIQRD
jgi:coenzyme Q-binding protein COQ10